MPVPDPYLVARNYGPGPLEMNTQFSSATLIRRVSLTANRGYDVTYIPKVGGAADGSRWCRSLKEALAAAYITEYAEGITEYADGKPR